MFASPTVDEEKLAAHIARRLWDGRTHLERARDGKQFRQFVQSEVLEVIMEHNRCDVDKQRTGDEQRGK